MSSRSDRLWCKWPNGLHFLPARGLNYWERPNAPFCRDRPVEGRWDRVNIFSFGL